MQPSLFAARQWTVSTLTRHIRESLEADIVLQDLWIEGEISNLSKPASGHVYFTLKDAGAALRCVIWKTNASRLELTLRDGLSVACHGRIGVYEVSGIYQLYVDRLTLAGEGALYQEFLRLKAVLEAEGLFDAARKRPIPPLPRRIGVVTSQSGAALRDVLNTLRRRLPAGEVVVAPSSVQGDDAPAQIVQALGRLNSLELRPDVVLLVRGGGSIEDLWAFNDPLVVRAITSSVAPVVCGVGHETDFTLSDFAADLRAPTPTAAAELATPVTSQELKERLRSTARQLAAANASLLQDHRKRLEDAAVELRHRSPERRIQIDRQRLDDLGHRVGTAQAHWLLMQAATIDGWRKRLKALDPLDILNRGYAVVTSRENGVLIRSIHQARGEIRVRVSDGDFDADVIGRTTREASNDVPR